MNLPTDLRVERTMRPASPEDDHPTTVFYDFYVADTYAGSGQVCIDRAGEQQRVVVLKTPLDADDLYIHPGEKYFEPGHAGPILVEMLAGLDDVVETDSTPKLVLYEPDSRVAQGLGEIGYAPVGQSPSVSVLAFMLAYNKHFGRPQ